MADSNQQKVNRGETGGRVAKPRKYKSNNRKLRRLDEHREIEALEARIVAGAPASGSNPLASSIAGEIFRQHPDPESAVSLPYAGVKLFEHLPISDKTLRGLADGKYTRMTAIQRAAIPHALCGRDVLGAAKTGSGKTLAFLIPVLENLYRLQWGSMDGVGAIIISPTRELSVQIFDELKKVGKYQEFSGGLLIGGRKDVDMEKDRVNSLNIIVCTPGRLLQHMDETPNFDCSQLQILVLDEADRILDMGFAKALNAIVSQLPKRQTLLFSATQTRAVQDLARLSLKDPEYLAVHAESAVATPTRLQQTAVIVPLEDKLDMLWSFIKTHLRSKTLVFLSSCKQVKFVHDAFKRLRPGVPIKCLHGRMKQAQRTIVFFRFCEEKHSVLFATDVAARGLDFPAVDWVVQVDCPEDVPSYIHRVGRTARFTSGGRSVLFLCPSEKEMLASLQAAKIPIKLIKANKNKLQRVSEALAGLLSKDPDLKLMAQRAFITYLRSIHLRADKEIFDVLKLPVEDYALSLGLPTTPRVKFIKKRASMLHVVEGTMIKDQVDGTRKDDDEDGFLTKKRAWSDMEGQEGEKHLVIGSLPTRVTKKKKLKINPNRPVGQRFVFDEEGNAVPPLAAFAKQKSAADIPVETGANIKMAAEERYRKLKHEMQKRDREDRLTEKQRLREKRLKKKVKLRKDTSKVSDESDGNDGAVEREEQGNVVAKKTYFKSDSSDYSGKENSDHEQPYEVETSKKQFARNGDVAPLTLAEQEALALKILNSRN